MSWILIKDYLTYSLNLHQLTSTYFNLHQLTSTYINLHQLTSTYINLHQLTSTYINLHQLTSTYFNLHQLTSTYINLLQLTSASSLFETVTSYNITNIYPHYGMLHFQLTEYGQSGVNGQIVLSRVR